MSTKSAILILAVITACGTKKSSSGETGSSGKAAESTMTCPAGQVVENGACVTVVTPAKIEAVVTQKSRLDDLATQLDKLSVVATSVELLNSFRELENWKQLTDKISQLKIVDEVIVELDTGVRTMRAFRAGLGETSTRLGNVQLELERVMNATGVSQKLADVRIQISEKVRLALEPLALQVADVLQKALLPLLGRMEQVQAAIDVGCGGILLGGGSDQAKSICKQAKQAFGDSLAFLGDFKQRPAKLYEDMTKELTAQLDQLIDVESKKILVAAQERVNAALSLPAQGAPGSAPGSAAPAPSGSTAPPPAK